MIIEASTHVDFQHEKELRIVRQPTAGVANRVLDPLEVHYLEMGDPVAVSGPVVAELGKHPPGATLLGTVEQQFEGGVAVWDDLRVDISGEFSLTVNTDTDTLLPPEPVYTEYQISVTIAPATVDSDLERYPCYVDMSGLPPAFWDKCKRDGGDIRVYDAAGEPIPFDLVRFDPIAQNGSLFVRTDISASSGAAFHVRYGNPALSRLPNEDPCGRNAVWEDFQHVFLLGESFEDRTGKVALDDILVNGTPNTFELASTSPNLGVHQGIAFDGTHYYAADTNHIKKYNSSWELVAENANPIGQIGNGTNHVGDPCVHDGVLYAPVENYVNIDTWSHQHLVAFDADTLQPIKVVDISAQGHEVSSCCIGPDGLLYVTSFHDGSKLWRYHPDDFSFVSVLELDKTIERIQGITFWRGAFWVTSDPQTSSGRPKRVVRVEADGKVWDAGVWGASGGNLEGIACDDDALLVLHDTDGSANGVVKRIMPLNFEVGGGVSASADVQIGVNSAELSQNSTLAVTLSINSNSGTSSMTAVNWSTRYRIGYHGSQRKIGTWGADNDLWLYTTAFIAPARTAQRVHTVYTGTGLRRLFLDGSFVQSAVGAVFPPGNSNLWIATSTAAWATPFNGMIGFVYLRLSTLSDSWVKAEVDNIRNPQSFYIVGEPVPVEPN